MEPHKIKSQKWDAYLFTFLNVSLAHPHSLTSIFSLFWFRWSLIWNPEKSLHTHPSCLNHRMSWKPMLNQRRFQVLWTWSSSFRFYIYLSLFLFFTFLSLSEVFFFFFSLFFSLFPFDEERVGWDLDNKRMKLFISRHPDWVLAS